MDDRMALSSLSLSSVNCISTPYVEFAVNTSRSEHEANQLPLTSKTKIMNSQLDIQMNPRNPANHQSLSPFKGLSPRKARPLTQDGFSIFNDEDSTSSNSILGVKSLVLLDIPTRDNCQSGISIESMPGSHISTSEQNVVYIDKIDKNSSTTGDSRNEDNMSETYAQSNMSDDTCFSTFSAVPDLNMATLTNFQNHCAQTSETPCDPKGPMFTTPATSNRMKEEFTNRSSSPTPRKNNQSSFGGETTNLLLDFTQQFNSYAPSYKNATQHHKSPNKYPTEPNLLSYMNSKRNSSPAKATPTRNVERQSLLNLLDLDLPPQPTPRSIPSITVRELESLKSRYLSEISHLRACLSGREAEVESLKRAVGDAERRVADAQEKYRDERGARQHAENEKAEWEKKGREVETVLRTVKEEFLRREKENEELLQKWADMSRLQEEHATNEAKTISNVARPQSTITESPYLEDGQEESERTIAKRVAHELDEKMENLARELHAVYKKKHESKVATLKKTYEARADKKCNELQDKIYDLTKQCKELQEKLDTNMCGMSPNALAVNEGNARTGTLSEQKTLLQSQDATIKILEDEIEVIRGERTQLLRDLEKERVEKGDLVAAVDEMLALQNENDVPDTIEHLKRSIRRPSTLRGPGVSDSKMMKMGASGSMKGTLGGKSRMMNNIERMGGRGVE